MGYDAAIAFKVMCVKCRSALETKDTAYCRQYDEGFTGVAINVYPCGFCVRNEAQRLVEKFKFEYEERAAAERAAKSRKCLSPGVKK